MTPSSAAGDALDAALRVARAIEALGGAYFLGGSLASSLQGEPRATNYPWSPRSISSRSDHRLTMKSSLPGVGPWWCDRPERR
jgi:hypothetical protein